MHASVKVIALGAFATLAAVASMTASAQSDGSDYRPMQTNNSAPDPQVSAGARAAARPAATESVGESTVAAPVRSQLTRAEVYKGAVEASHPMNTESIGESTGTAGITSGTPR